VFGFRNKPTGSVHAELFSVILPGMKESKPVDSRGEKRPYSSPAVTKLTPEQAADNVKDRTNCSEQEAKEFVESLREQY
jgi:hypothetical protein